MGYPNLKSTERSETGGVIFEMFVAVGRWEQDLIPTEYNSSVGIAFRLYLPTVTNFSLLAPWDLDPYVVLEQDNLCEDFQSKFTSDSDLLTTEYQINCLLYQVTGKKNQLLLSIHMNLR